MLWAPESYAEIFRLFDYKEIWANIFFFKQAAFMVRLFRREKGQWSFS
jgi:hypothetical protein